MFRVIVIGLLLMTASLMMGCARLSGDIQSFSQLSAQDLTKTIIVQPADDIPKNNLAFKSYKALLEKHLDAQGFQVTQDADKAELIAVFQYGIDDKVEIEETFDKQPTFTLGGSIGSSGKARIGTRYTIPIDIGAENVYESYHRHIALNIMPADTINNNDGPTVLYEGRVQSKGRCAVLFEVMDEMLTLLFEKFPDQSGKASIRQQADC